MTNPLDLEFKIKNPLQDEKTGLEIGNKFEKVVARYLIKKGYTVLGKPKHRHFDIIAKRGKTIIAVECKATSKGKPSAIQMAYLIEEEKKGHKSYMAFRDTNGKIKLRRITDTRRNPRKKVKRKILGFNLEVPHFKI